MTKKDYIRAAEIVQQYYKNAAYPHNPELALELQRQAIAIQGAFIALFRKGGGRFDVERFREACNKV
ncbi:MAG: hypothetical protein AAB649_01685 [Patescibacteria group bacterium]